MDRNPDFLIVGTMKSGTNTLGRYLEKHPGVYMAPREIQYFSDEDRYAKGDEWYFSHFETASAGQICGERSPGYYSATHGPERVQASVPNSKFIWIFRDPIDRAYSQYWHFAIRGGEKLPFGKAVANEENWPEWRKTRGYLYRSHYAVHVAKWLELFPREQMLFLLFEELKTNPQAVIDQLFDFLGVDSLPALSSKKIVSHRTPMPRNLPIHHLGVNLLRSYPRLLHYFKKVSLKSEPGYPPMEATVREELYTYFAPHNQQLAELTGLDLSLWKQDIGIKMT